MTDYILALNAIGVDKFITGGHLEYYRKNNHKVLSSPSNCQHMFPTRLPKPFKFTRTGENNYIEMSQGLANSGWKSGHLIPTN